MGWLKGEAGKNITLIVRRCSATVMDLFLSQVARPRWVHHRLAERSSEQMALTKQHFHPCPLATGVLFLDLVLN
jgi:hypothetical protein